MKNVEHYRHNAAPQANPIANITLIMQGVIWEILDRYETTWNVILSRKRTARISDARHLIASFLAWHSNRSLVEIGHLLGGRDHGTIIHSRRKIFQLYEADLQVRNLVDDLEERHLGIADHSAIVRDRSELPTSSGFVLPGCKIPSPIKPRPRDSDGRRTMSSGQLRAEGNQARRRA
jgi:hypothetical protein